MLFVLVTLSLFPGGALKMPPAGANFRPGHAYLTKNDCEAAASSFNAIDFREIDADNLPTTIRLRAFCVAG
jgi:hypothetical protein